MYQWYHGSRLQEETAGQSDAVVGLDLSMWLLLVWYEESALWVRSLVYLLVIADSFVFLVEHLW